ILTAQDQEQILFEAIRAGAAAYLHKDCEPAELIDAIRKVRNGQFIINEKIFSRPAVASKVLAEFRELSVYGPGSTHVFAPLSPREVQILDNIAQGMTNKEVAYALAISEQTVKNHMSSILRKLSVNDRTQAVVYAIRQGWIKGPEMGNRRRPRISARTSSPSRPGSRPRYVSSTFSSNRRRPRSRASSRARTRPSRGSKRRAGTRRISSVRRSSGPPTTTPPRSAGA